MSFRSGYDYSYEVMMSPSSPEAGIQRNKVELQTYFMIHQRKDGDAHGGYEMLGTERMSVTLPKSFEHVCDPFSLFAQFTYRLKEYSMPSGQIQSLVHDALVALGSSVPISPIFINVKVCTVQLDGEPIIDAMERSITPECLVPSDLVRTIGKKDKSWRRSRFHKFLLFGLPRVRGDELLMETCPVCLDGPTAVVPVSKLPSCGHAFHSHCVVRWFFMNNKSCPMCRQDKIILLKEGGAKVRPITRARSTNNYLPRRPRRVLRPTRERRVPSWHRDFVVGSTNRLPSPARVRRTPTILLVRRLSQNFWRKKKRGLENRHWTSKIRLLNSSFLRQAAGSAPTF